MFSELVLSSRLCFVVLALLPFMLSCSSAADAGSLVEARLATVDQVAVEVSGGLFFKDIPGGLEKDAFRGRLEGVVEFELAKCSVGAVDSGGQELHITLDRARNGPGHLVFSVGVELREPAVLIRSVPAAASKEDLWVTSWQRWDLVATTAEDAIEDLDRAIAYLVNAFAGSVAAARDEYVAEVGELPDCFD